MKILDGAELAGFIQARHEQLVATTNTSLKLSIVVCGSDPATLKYSRVKQRYGDSIGIAVEIIPVDKDNLKSTILLLNGDNSVTGIIVPLPLPPTINTDEILALIDSRKDIDGLGPNSPFQAATPKGILWLLAGCNVDMRGRIGIVGQGRLVGRPLADSLIASGYDVVRCDELTTDLGAVLRDCRIVVSATGQPALIESDMLASGTVVVDAGSPFSELAADVRERQDLIISPNPGGVGPMTVAALFDNLLIAADNKK